ncbi:DUF4232 domain-containing protein [Streptomyces sp. NPDC006544]|uniref:DUF4232 domain-containing protein n=1 Tax=Streptomyces sp. NPDC006544 TaxID=3154583 RepID=UPI0033B03E02
MKRTKRDGTARRCLRARSLGLPAGALACGLFLGAAPAASAQETGGLRAAAAPCAGRQLIANSAERTGFDQVRITVINDGPKACVLKGYPTVALAGQGSPDHNKPLVVIRQGPARAVRLEVGDRASTQLTFTPVLGEADGYCASGAQPSAAPSIVLGVGGGGLQLAPDDGGRFALCGTSLHATAFRGSAS